MLPPPPDGVPALPTVVLAESSLPWVSAEFALTISDIRVSAVTPAVMCAATGRAEER